MDEFKPQPLTIRLDAPTVRRLEQLKRQIDASLPEGVIPPYSIAALARHSIHKWCEHVSAPVPNPCLTEEQQREQDRKLAQAQADLKRGE